LHFRTGKSILDGVLTMSSKSKKLKKPFERGASRKSEEGQGGKNRGAYESPLSGVGVVHDSDWTIPPSRGVVIHECGYLEKNREWNFTWVFSPFWRFYFNTEPGHNVVIGNKVVEMTQDRIVVIPPHRQFHCRSTRTSLRNGTKMHFMKRSNPIPKGRHFFQIGAMPRLVSVPIYLCSANPNP